MGPTSLTSTTVGKILVWFPVDMDAGINNEEDRITSRCMWTFAVEFIFLYF